MSWAAGDCICNIQIDSHLALNFAPRLAVKVSGRGWSSCQRRL